MAARKKKAAAKKPVKRKAKAKPKRPLTPMLGPVDPRPKHLQGGRPTKFNRELALELCSRLAAGESLIRICRSCDEMPNEVTVRRWMLGQQGIPSKDLDWFRQVYAEARRIYEDHVFDELQDVRHDVLVSANHIALGKLWSDNVKWGLARMNRAKYGDKTDIGLGGTVDAPPVTVKQAPTLDEMREALRIVDEVSASPSKPKGGASD